VSSGGSGDDGIDDEAVDSMVVVVVVVVVPTVDRVEVVEADAAVVLGLLEDVPVEPFFFGVVRGFVSAELGCANPVAVLDVAPSVLSVEDLVTEVGTEPVESAVGRRATVPVLSPPHRRSEIPTTSTTAASPTIVHRLPLAIRAPFRHDPARRCAEFSLSERRSMPPEYGRIGSERLSKGSCRVGPGPACRSGRRALARPNRTCQRRATLLNQGRRRPQRGIPSRHARSTSSRNPSRPRLR
jgi:hypothetical protein